MIIILGDFDLITNKLIVICLSKKTYQDVNIIINSKNYKLINIDAFQVKRICIDLKEFDITNLNIKFETSNKKILDKINNLNLDSNKLFNNIEVVNCDSAYGVEKNLWKKIENVKSRVIIHCGDQIYNDCLFKKYYRGIEMNDENINALEKRIFCAYYNQFHRYKSILKNNLNLMIPDDHEVVDDAYENKYGTDEKFIKVKKIFVDAYTKIQLGLKLNNDDIYYLEDNKNSTLYVLNYQEFWTKKLLDEYNFDSKIIPYKNVILISRKSLLSYKFSLPNELVYTHTTYKFIDIDFILNKFINTNKKLVVLCGDDHSYIKSIIKDANGKSICTIITCGPINSVPVLFKDEILFKTKIPNITIFNKSFLLVNSFIRIKYNSGKLKVNKVIYKTNPITNIWDNIISVVHFL